MASMTSCACGAGATMTKHGARGVNCWYDATSREWARRRSKIGRDWPNFTIVLLTMHVVMMTGPDRRSRITDGIVIHVDSARSIRT